VSKYEDIFGEAYLAHYARGNITIEPNELAAAVGPNFEATYGQYMNLLPPNSRVLDLGCGTGSLLGWLSQKPGIVPVGVDRSPSMVKVARQFLPNIEIALEDGLTYLNDHPASFSAIFCCDVMAHLPTPEICIEWSKAARRALIPGGFLICREPNAANLTSSHLRYMDITHMRSFTSYSIIQLLETAGFKDCRCVPIRFKSLARQLHMNAVTLFHLAFFLFCGNRRERHFHRFISGVGFNLEDNHQEK
jgi:SAM-dependent methyltransferase